MKTKIDKILKEGNIVKLLDLFKKNLASIADLNETEKTVGTGSWTRKVARKTTFSFEKYLFEIVNDFDQYYDIREDDGGSAGWTTTEEQSVLIVKNKSGEKLLKTDISEYDYYFEVILGLVEEKFKKLPKDLRKTFEFTS